MHDHRFVHTATLLKDGTALVAGGTNGSEFLDSAEIYDPQSGTWSRAGSMSVNRYGHTATLLTTGEVLIVGGFNGANKANVHIFDPEIRRWRRAADLHKARDRHTATLLARGEVLVAGGLLPRRTVGGCRDLRSPGVTSKPASGSLGCLWQEVMIKDQGLGWETASVTFSTQAT